MAEVDEVKVDAATAESPAEEKVSVDAATAESPAEEKVSVDAAPDESPEEEDEFVDAAPDESPAPAGEKKYKSQAEKRIDIQNQALCGDSHSVGVFLEEVAYFLEDMQKDLWWLLKAVHQPGFDPAATILTGNEELAEGTPEIMAAIDELRKRAEEHAESHPNQVRSKITIIPNVTSEERKTILNKVKELKVHCRGKIEVFLCVKDANHAAIWAAYHKYVQAQQPQWLVNTDWPMQKTLFAQCSVVVPVYVDVKTQALKLFGVWCPEKKKRHYAFPDGDIIRGYDRHLFDSARREFDDEVGVFFNRPWEECFVTQLPQEWNATDRGVVEMPPEACIFNQLEKDGPRYPCRPHFFVQVTEDFYEATRCYEDAVGVISLKRALEEANSKDATYVRWDDECQTTQHTKEGVKFLEHDEAMWLTLGFQDGVLKADDNRQVRIQNVELMKTLPEKLWKWFASLLGCEPPERAAILPKDYDTEGGSFAVRMSGIDKTATDDDIGAFFEAASIRPKSVVQHQVPKHTAKIEFDTVKDLENALMLSNRNLLRRKVKIELWTDTGGEVEAEAASLVKTLTEFDGVLSAEGPWMLRCRGLDRAATRDDLGYFFWDRSCQVKDVNFPLKGEKHAGIIEMSDQESCRKALSLSGAIFKGREMQIELNTKKDEEPSRGGGGKDRERGDRGDRPPRDRERGVGKGERDRGDRDRGDRGDRGDRDRGDRGGGKGYPGRDGGRDAPSRADFGSERPKLILKPRTAPPVEADSDERFFRPQGQQGGDGRAPLIPGGPGLARTDPFGGARPRDDRFKATRADGDDNWRK